MALNEGNAPKYIGEIVFDGKTDDTSYLSALPVVSFLKKNKKLTFHKNVTFFVGENGTGKSTLLEAIAVAYGFNAEGGTKNFRFSTKDTHSELFNHLRLVKESPARDGFFLRAESLYNVASYIDELDGGVLSYGGASLHSLSHGESFFAVMQNRFGGNGLYLLDEPEAALSPMKLMSLICLIRSLVMKNSQFIIATHSPILMAYPGAEVMEFSQNGIQSVNYRETEHYKTTKDFIDNPERIFHYLFEE